MGREIDHLRHSKSNELPGGAGSAPENFCFFCGACGLKRMVSLTNPDYPGDKAANALTTLRNNCLTIESFTERELVEEGMKGCVGKGGPFNKIDC